MRKTLLLLLLCVGGCLPQGPAVDRIKGFRTYELGASLKRVEPVSFVLPNPSHETKVAQVDPKDLAEKSVWGHRIRFIVLLYWRDQLTEMQVFLAPVPIERQIGSQPVASEEERAAFAAIFAAAQEVYGRPTSANNNVVAGAVDTVWEGKANRVWLSAKRHPKHEDSEAGMYYEIRITSKTLEAAMNDANRDKPKYGLPAKPAGK